MSSDPQSRGLLWRIFQKLRLRYDLLVGRRFMAECPLFVMKDLKVAYFAVPKAANSSIKRALFPQITGKPHRKGIKIHDETRPFVRKFKDIKNQIDDDWFVFTVVRHPGKRAASAWRDKVDEHATPFRPVRSMGINGRVSFDFFLDRVVEWPVAALNDHFLPQTQLLRHAFKLPKLQVFKVEALENDWQIIRAELEKRGAKGIPDLGNFNATKNKAAVDLNTPAVRQSLEKVYGADYDQLAYDFP